MKPTIGVCPSTRTAVFQLELSKKGINHVVFDLEDIIYHDGEFELVSRKQDLEHIDCLITRRFMAPPRVNLEQFSFFSLFYRVLEEKLPVINSLSSHLIAVDKLETHYLLKKHGLPVPDTRVFPGAESTDEATFDSGGSSFIIKPVFGSKGTGIAKTTDPATLKGLADRYFHHGEVFFMQEFIDSGEKDGSYHDIRLFVVNGEVVASMKRKSNSSWLTNISQSAVPESFTPDEEQKELAIKTAEICGTFYAGVDIIQSSTGESFVLEINSFPGWDGLQRVNKVNIPGTVIDAILDRYF